MKDTFIGAAALDARIMAGAAAGLNAAIQDIEQAALQVTPMDTGDLRASAHVEGATPGKAMSTSLSFGGGDVDYAARVHLGLADSGAPIQNWTTAGTGPFYLQKTFENSRGNIVALLAGAINRSIGF